MILFNETRIFSIDKHLFVTCIEKNLIKYFWSRPFYQNIELFFIKVYQQTFDT